MVKSNLLWSVEASKIKINLICVLSALLFIPFLSSRLYAQVTNSENFSGTTFVPSGWTNLNISGGNQWFRVTAGSHPTSCNPYSSPAMARFDSWDVAGGTRAIITPSFDLRGRGSNTPTVSFRMYRESGFPSDPDKVEVYVNTAANLSGATLLGTIHRSRALTPAETANGWYQYPFNIPAGYNGATNYIIFNATSAYGNDIYIDDVEWISYPNPCSGTPSPGNTVSATPMVCNSSTSFTLTLQNATPGLGVTYQWDSSTNGTSWTAIAGATSATYTGTQTVSRYYRCRVTCSGNTGTSTPLQIVNSFLACYCPVGLSNCYQYDDIIYKVEMGTLSNSSGCPGASLSYMNYSSTVAAPLLARGTNPTIAVTVGFGADDYASVWIDTNQNGVFDATEYKFVGSGNGNTITNSTLALTNSAKLGNTMMRVRINWNAEYTATEACSTYTYGETEDYMVRIVPQTPTAINGERCGAGNAVCAVSSNTGASSPSYRWYLAPSGGTAIAGQTGASLSAYSITSTTVFHVSEIIGDVESIRVPVTATVNVPPNASVTSSTNVTCFNGTNGTATTSIATNTGTAPFGYSWNSTPVQNSATATNLPPGTYICTVTDNKTCTDTAVVVINNANPNTIPAITTSPSNATICAGTNTTFTAEGTGLNITYQWQLSTTATGPFNNITTSGGGIYSGFTTSVLSITGATPSMNGYRYRCVVSGTCSPSATTLHATLTVNSAVPAISISASGNPVCSGTNVTFNITSTTNPGTSPQYEWRRNGSIVGTGTTYSSSALANGDVVICSLTSNVTCPYPAKVGSNAIAMTVNPIVTPTISISSNAGTTVCAGATVTFNATISGGGTSPAYQWKRNNVNVATGSSYATSSLTNGDVITCQLTSNVPCPNPAIVNSNSVMMTVIPNVTPSVSTSASATAVCPGGSITFTATGTNGGNAPTYQWTVNGNGAGTNSATFTNASFQNGDVVVCNMTSSVTCVTSSTASSVPISVTVLPILTPALTITASPDTFICAGTNVVFSTIPTNGGTNPVYQWKINGADMVGALAGVYSASVLNSGDVVSCVMTSNANCAIPSTATSNQLNFLVQPASVPAAQIYSDKGSAIIEGDVVTFTAAVMNVGYTPTYRWTKNGVDVQTGVSHTYTTNELKSNDVVSVVVNSSDACSNPDSVVSNGITMMVIPTGISKVDEKVTDISLYPNPNKAKFVVEAELSTPANDIAIEVLNSLGQVIYKEQVAAPGNKLQKEISLGDVASGVYYVRITADGKHMMKRFVVQY